MDSTALTTTLTVSSGTLSVTTGAGVTGNGTGSVTITGTATQINTALAGLTYTGNLNFNGPDTLTVTTGDGIVQDIDTVAITVNPLADPPVNTVPAAQSVNEDATLAIAGVSVADPDVGTLTTTLTVTSGTLSVTAGPGVSGNGTAAVTITGTAAQINAALAGLSYTGNLNFNGPDTLTVTTGDGTAQDIDTVAITVNPLADPPVNTVPAAQSVNEDTLLPIAGVSVADVDSSALTTTLTVLSGTLSVTAGPGVSGNGTATVIITGTATEINTALAGLAYTGNLNFNGPDTLTVTTGDGTAQDIDTVAITVNAVNDAPVNTVPGAQSVNEDTALAIGGISVADVDSATVTTTVTVTNGQLLVAAGGRAAVLNNASNTVTITGAPGDVNAALAALTYLGNTNFNGSDTLTVSTTDGTSTDIDTVAITVNPVNDQPVLDLDADDSGTGAGGVYITSFTEDGAGAPVADLDALIADPDDADLEGATIRLVNPHADDVLLVNGTLPGAIVASSYNAGTGTLTLSGLASLADYQTALHQIEFGNTGQAPADIDRLLIVTIDDGVATSSKLTVVAVTATPDAPVNTVPGPQSVDEDAALAIGGVSVADPDDGPTAPLSTELSVTNGVLSVALDPGLVITGNGTGNLTIEGPADLINNALLGLAYSPNANFNGGDTLTLTTSDGVLTDIDTVAITVNPRQRCACKQRAGAAKRQRGRDAGDRRCVGRGRGQLDADDHADGDERHDQRDRRSGREQQRHRHGDHHRHGRADQHVARRAVLHRQSQLQRSRHAHGHHWRRHRAGHRHGRDHRQPAGRSAGQHRAGRAGRQ